MRTILIGLCISLKLTANLLMGFYTHPAQDSVIGFQCIVAESV